MKQNLLFVVSIIFLPIFAFFAYWIYFLSTPIISDAKGITLTIKQGTGLHGFANQLQAKGLINYPSLLTLYGHLQGNPGIKSGEYLFTKGTTPIMMVSQVINGTGLAYHPFAIIPGWTFAQVREALNQAEGLSHTIQNMSDQQLMQRLGSKVSSPEGQFYPETYNYTRGDSDLDVLKRAYDLMQTRLQDTWANRSSKLPYQSPYAALIAASLIEKEAYLSSERPIIAGVIINRLDTNMPLQIDPTVVYALGNKYSGKIYKNDLLIDSPYNTYLYRGLPPTPIAMPSQSSLEAAMQPQPNNYFYYVARGDGSHQFSQTLNEHNAAVAAIIKQQDVSELKNDSRQVH